MSLAIASLLIVLENFNWAPFIYTSQQLFTKNFLYASVLFFIFTIWLYLLEKLTAGL